MVSVFVVVKIRFGFECEKIVLEEDGAEIEDDEVLEELSGQLFIALTTGEEWMPKKKHENPGPIQQCITLPEQEDTEPDNTPSRILTFYIFHEK